MRKLRVSKINRFAEDPIVTESGNPGVPGLTLLWRPSWSTEGRGDEGVSCGSSRLLSRDKAGSVPVWKRAGAWKNLR